MVQHDVAYYLKRAGPLAEKVAASADQIGSERQMPPDLADELADDGFFRLLLPRSLGGAELAHSDFRRILRVFGQAEATWRSVDAFLRSAADSAWEDVIGNPRLDLERRIALRLASAHAIRMAAQVVGTAYSRCVAGVIFASNPIQRRFQDMHVITQHTQGSYAHYYTAGQFLLGLDPESSFQASPTSLRLLSKAPEKVSFRPVNRAWPGFRALLPPR